MAFDVRTYQFSKKINSTIRPPEGSELATYTGTVLKDSCSILTPNIKLNIGTVESTIPNYVYIHIWKRFYYVTDIKWENGIWILNLKVDALATWRTEIGAQSLYILRSSSEHDGDIMDNLYPAKSTPRYSSIINDTLWNTEDLTRGTFVVGVAGQSTTYYTFTYNALQLFLQYILGELYAAELTTNWSTVFTSLNWESNAMQFITSINWFPFEHYGLAVSTIRVGFVDVPVSAGEISGSGMVFFSYTLQPERHPQSEDRGSFLNNAPYSSYSLFYPPFGQIDIDPSVVAAGREFELLVGVDLRTGKGTLSVIENRNVILATWAHAQIALPYQTTQIMTQGTFDISKAMSTGGGMIPTMAGGGAASVTSGLISGGVSAIGDYARGKIPSSRTLGSNGGMNSLRGAINFLCEFKMLVNDSNQDRGRPLCKIRRIDTISNYIMVSDADIEIPAMESEQQEIRNYMEGGFFFE